jgi:prepilin peptidase CpaA
MTGVELAGLAVLAAIGGVGAYLDIGTRRLPNWLCLIGLLAGAGFSVIDGGWSVVLMALLHALVALLVGMGLFAMRWIGGGDAKFYAALAAWFPLQAGLGLLVTVSLTGLLLLIAWLPFRRRLMRADSGVAIDSDFRKVPYGVAIAGGAVIHFAMRQFL